MITSLVIMAIGNNLARAFGLVGAMSIIRFRTAVKDTQDIVFIFFSLAIGMAAGVGQFMTAVTGTLAVGLVLLGLSQIQTHVQKKREYLLQFLFIPRDGEEAPYLPVFMKYCRRHHLVNTRSSGSNGQLELSFYIHLKDQRDSDRFVSELGEIADIRNINLFFDEEYS